MGIKKTVTYNAEYSETADIHMWEDLAAELERLATALREHGEPTSISVDWAKSTGPTVAFKATWRTSAKA